MIKVETVNVNSDISETELIEARIICYDLCPVSLKHEIYIEFWSDEQFRSYFSCGKKMLEQPLGPDKLVEGFHDFSNHILTTQRHEIAIIKNSNWRITLKHEMIHVYCAEILGMELWNKYGNLFKDQRFVDPFEYVAIALSKPQISESDMITSAKRLTWSNL